MILMIAYVFLDNIFRHSVTNCAGKLAIFPELSSQQFPFHFRISLEYGAGRWPLQTLHKSKYRIFRWKTQKYMDMILRNFHLLYLKIMVHCDLWEALLNKSPKASSQYPFSVFGSPYNTISRIVYSMTCSFDSHANRLCHLNLNFKDNVSSPL